MKVRRNLITNHKNCINLNEEGDSYQVLHYPVIKWFDNPVQALEFLTELCSDYLEASGYPA